MKFNFISFWLFFAAVLFVVSAGYVVNGAEDCTYLDAFGLGERCDEGWRIIVQSIFLIFAAGFTIGAIRILYVENLKPPERTPLNLDKN